MNQHLLKIIFCITSVGLIGQSCWGQSGASFTAEVSSATAGVFGVNITPGTIVNGFFIYDTSTPDFNVADSNRGDYRHTGGGSFLASFQGFNVEVQGSAIPFVQIENFTGADTFRFIDGDTASNQVNPPGVMSVNGTPDNSVGLFLAITDNAGDPFSDDSLPSMFPMTIPPSLPNTFVLNDEGGNIVLQLTSLNSIPEPGSAFFLSSVVCLTVMRRRRRRGNAG